MSCVRTDANLVNTMSGLSRVSLHKAGCVRRTRQPLVYATEPTSQRFSLAQGKFLGAFCVDPSEPHGLRSIESSADDVVTLLTQTRKFQAPTQTCTMSQRTIDALRARLHLVQEKDAITKRIINTLQERTRLVEEQNERRKAGAALTSDVEPTFGYFPSRLTPITDPKHTMGDCWYRIVILYYETEGNPVDKPWTIKDDRMLKAAKDNSVPKVRKIMKSMQRRAGIASSNCGEVEYKAQLLDVHDIVELQELEFNDVGKWVRDIEAKGLGKDGKPVLLYAHYYHKDDEEAARIAFSCYWD